MPTMTRISLVMDRPHSELSVELSAESVLASSAPSAGTSVTTGALVMFIPDTVRVLPLLARPALKIAVRPDESDDSVFAVMLLATLLATVLFGVSTA